MRLSALVADGRVEHPGASNRIPLHSLLALLVLRRSAFGNTAMAEAVKNSHDNIIDLLLSYGGT